MWACGSEGSTSSTLAHPARGRRRFNKHVSGRPQVLQPRPVHYRLQDFSNVTSDLGCQDPPCFPSAYALGFLFSYGVVYFYVCGFLMVLTKIRWSIKAAVVLMYFSSMRFKVERVQRTFGNVFPCDEPLASPASGCHSQCDHQYRAGACESRAYKRLVPLHASALLNTSRFS